MSCLTKRQGKATLRLSNLPFASFDLTFVGVGAANVSREGTLEDVRAEETVEMEWSYAKFIGNHWLLGPFTIKLNPSKRSFGIINGKVINNGIAEAVNRNNLYFNFNFPRFNYTIANDDPIENEAKVTSIPPSSDSVYSLVKNKLKATLNNKKSIKIDFKYCEITIYPERNIGVKLLKNEKKGNKYFISIEYTNLTAESVTAAYFLVLHDADLITHDDAGLKKLGPKESFVKIYEVGHKKHNVTSELPIYGGIFKPTELNGSGHITLKLTF